MMDTAKKCAALVKIAKALNQSGITWAVGGSSLLYFKGIAQKFNDIDIMIAEHDVAKVKALLNNHEKSRQGDFQTQYRSKFFGEYVIEGVDFDLIAGFTIVNKNGVHYYPLDEANIKEIAVIDKTSIPLQSVEDWTTYYNLMGRTDKVEMIKHKH
ncbi:nucleotidyltransferase family protein [Sporolactobacillus shoreicorticis]|uniref:Nucleotidyltransferase family protein n=1 Tax=Sporolactobacillus shoreicorticis TaxID=1923877 RepID=A0ABW5S1P5_9BACL|nr:nucleotidyltransferase family protein [Sporolactobacillus shoreicorticis]MCO7125050.1 nucleotidyltransferase family protein [Sporolactobacillus shoreicorticis]